MINKKYIGLKNVIIKLPIFKISFNSTSYLIDLSVHHYTLPNYIYSCVRDLSVFGLICLFVLLIVVLIKDY